MALNNLTLFCRECLSSWEDINPDSGVCNNCDTPNVLTLYQFEAVSESQGLRAPVSGTGYTLEQVKDELSQVVKHLINRGALPEDTEVK